MNIQRERIELVLAYGRLLLKEHSVDATIVINPELPSTTMGRSHVGNKAIELNPLYIESLHEPLTVSFDTVAHEVAHLLAPHDGHGSIWREKAKLVGATPLATSAIDRDSPSIKYILVHPNYPNKILGGFKIKVDVSRHMYKGELGCVLIPNPKYEDPNLPKLPLI